MSMVEDGRVTCLVRLDVEEESDRGMRWRMLLFHSGRKAEESWARLVFFIWSRRNGIVLGQVRCCPRTSYFP